MTTPIHLCWTIIYEDEDSYAVSSSIFKTLEAAQMVALTVNDIGEEHHFRPVAILQLFEWIQVQEGLRDLHVGENIPSRTLHVDSNNSENVLKGGMYA